MSILDRRLARDLWSFRGQALGSERRGVIALPDPHQLDDARVVHQTSGLELGDGTRHAQRLSVGRHGEIPI